MVGFYRKQTARTIERPTFDAIPKPVDTVDISCEVSEICWHFSREASFSSGNIAWQYRARVWRKEAPCAGPHC